MSHFYYMVRRHAAAVSASDIDSKNDKDDDMTMTTTSRRGLEVARSVEAGSSRVRGRIIAGL